MPLELDEGRLDDAEAVVVLDRAEMLRAVASSGAQVRRATEASLQAGVAGLDGEGRPRSVVVLGMGGSGSAGNVLSAVAGPGCPVPVVTNRGYHLPGWVGPMDLVIAVSFSGTTEETLVCAEEAVRRGARLLVVAGEGSPLAGTAERGRGLYVPVVGDGRQPRASLWELAVPLLVAANALRLADVPTSVLDATADLLDDLAGRYGPSTQTYENPAKALAVQLAGTVPLVWGSGDLAGAAAYRFACQLAENAKYPAEWGTLPEAGHNQVVTVDGPFARQGSDQGDFFRDRLEEPFGAPRLKLVLLRDDAEEHPQLARRRQATVALMEQRGVPVQEVAAEGEHRLERLASLVAAADFTSVYLALVLGIDPTPVDAITYVKEQIGS